MGAWGHQIDEDDTALDWLGGFEEDMNWSVAEMVFKAVQTADYVEYDDCCAALVAGEIVASALGRSNERLSDSVKAWSVANAGDGVALKSMAHEAVGRVRSGSELSELWSESEEAASWESTVDDLLLRLK
jgi:hypothetical protein